MIEHIKSFFTLSETGWWTQYLIEHLRWEQYPFTSKRLAYRMEPEVFSDQVIQTILISSIKAVSDLRGKPLNIQGVFFNYYRNGNDETPYHRDSYGTTVVTVSFGVTRDFLMKPDSGPTQKYILEHGDIFVFDKDDNSKYRHSLPVRKRVTEPRISVVIFCE